LVMSIKDHWRNPAAAPELLGRKDRAFVSDGRSAASADQSSTKDAKPSIQEAIETTRAYFHSTVQYWTLRHSYLERLSSDPSATSNDPHLYTLAEQAADAYLDMSQSRSVYFGWARTRVKNSRRKQWSRLEDAIEQANPAVHNYEEESRRQGSYISS